MQEGPSGLPLALPLKRVIKPCEKCPPYTRRKGPILSPKRRQEESEQAGLVKFLPVYYTYLTLPHLSYFYIKPGINILKFNDFLGLHFLMKTPTPHQTYIEETWMLFSWLLYQFIFRSLMGP